MENVVLTIHLILALLLIGIVLMQRSEGGGLGIGGGGGGAMSARGAATALTKLTWILAAAFIVTSITLTILATRGANTKSVADSVAVDAPATTEADVAAPSTEAEAPATLPRAEEPAPETPAPAAD
ncbi:MAG: preprotein translocase subunit SecG [Rhodobacterales bacterium 32-66-7]|nr:MAG: preprotein translocase subunit SecG [Rhodobacterales bacterium 32-66-7]